MNNVLYISVDIIGFILKDTINYNFETISFLRKNNLIINVGVESNFTLNFVILALKKAKEFTYTKTIHTRIEQCAVKLMSGISDTRPSDHRSDWVGTIRQYNDSSGLNFNIKINNGKLIIKNDSCECADCFNNFFSEELNIRNLVYDVYCKILNKLSNLDIENFNDLLSLDSLEIIIQ